MAHKNLFATIFVFACFLTCRGEDCGAYDEMGSCSPPCSSDMVLYSAGCLDPTMSERTCRHPEARSLGVRCDYSRCECPDPKVFDEAVKRCVTVDACSDQSNVNSTRSDK